MNDMFVRVLPTPVVALRVPLEPHKDGGFHGLLTEFLEGIDWFYTDDENGHVVLAREQGGEFALPGQWIVRVPEGVLVRSHEGFQKIFGPADPGEQP
ncbi:hypothetical protein [Sphingobium yanoikuyae]|uniref:hypothetical protein n=1 Tax=Sphingobium yanoikuyae TaxID=13690 RepID=UPI002431D890|nr:hypothetical protein [Sphingobium yanoikuyae]